MYYLRVNGYAVVVSGSDMDAQRSEFIKFHRALIGKDIVMRLNGKEVPKWLFWYTEGRIGAQELLLDEHPHYEIREDSAWMKHQSMRHGAIA